MRRTLGLLALVAAPLVGAVDGTVTNSTTGKPQPGVIVNLVQPSNGGMDPIGNTVTDAQGKFKIDKPAEGMQLVQAIYQGVPYNKMISPGSPTTGVQVEVFDATRDPATARVSQHIVFFQPASSQLSVNEVYFLKNDTNKTYNNPAGGTLQFYIPAPNAQVDSVRVTINAPGGMPIQRPAEATKAAGVFKVDYPAKPGETEFNIAYAMPAGTEFSSKSLQPGEIRLVVPIGVTLEGNALTSIGPDPGGKAALYSVPGPEYRVKINGTVEAAPAAASGAPDEDTGQPQIQQTNPRIYGDLAIILGLAATVLLLGFLILYRTGGSRGKAPK